MTRWELLKAIRASMLDPDRIGDVVVLKSELSSQRASPEIEALLDDVRGYHPPLDIDALGTQPDGTFGREYARFLADNGLSPITITGNLPEEMVARNAFVVRYGIIHDMVHVLTGFDASWPGEAGVWAFVGVQKYSTMFRAAGLMSLLVAPLMCPLQLGRAWRCWKRGRALGREAKLLLTLRLEDHLSEPLDAVRAQVGITPPAAHPA